MVDDADAERSGPVRSAVTRPGVALLVFGVVAIVVGIALGFWEAEALWYGTEVPISKECGGVWYVDAYYNPCEEVLDHRTRLVFSLIPAGIALAVLGAGTLLARRLPQLGWWATAVVTTILVSGWATTWWTETVLETHRY